MADNGKILMVCAEDEPDMLDAYRDTLEFYLDQEILNILDFRFVLSTNDLGKILDEVTEEVKLILLTDFSIVGGSGPEFLISYFKAQLRAFGRDLSKNVLGLAVLSGYPEYVMPMAELKAAIPAERVVYFSKPVNPDKIVAFIKEAIARAVAKTDE